MNYLTNYYKNLCEQLQDQVNNLSSKLNILNEMEGRLGSMETSEPIAGNQAAPSGGTVTTSDQAPPKPVKPVRQKGESQEQWQRALDRYAEQVRAYNEWLARHPGPPSNPRNPTLPRKPATTPQPPPPEDWYPKPKPKPAPIPRPNIIDPDNPNPFIPKPRVPKPQPQPRPVNPNDVGPPAPAPVYPFPVQPINPYQNKRYR